MMDLVPSDCRTVIVAPLNWGLGHATRSIPIIRQLIGQNIEVIIASDGEALELLQLEFPQLTTEVLPSYGVKYQGNTLLNILIRNSLNVLSAMYKENKCAKYICDKYKPQLIISDSRFGFRREGIKSVIISHQLNVQCKNKWLKSLLDYHNTRILNAFDECWIPDDSQRILSGELSSNRKVNNQQFIGPISRLDHKSISPASYELAIILSGPEPARTKLEERLIGHYNSLKSDICLVRGTNALAPLNLPSNWTVYNLAQSTTINEILLASQKIISRSGYTSIMDYAHLGVSAQLIPTPGQTEQMYLADYLDGKLGFSKWEDE